MIEFFEFALQGFWRFVGVLMLAGLLCRYTVRLVVGSLSALRGTPVHFGTRFGNDDAKRAIISAFKDGDFDQEVANAQVRNTARKHV